MTAHASIRDADRERAKARRTAFKARWPNEFRDGARCAFMGEYPGERERGGYPKGFHQWPLERRDAWFAGFNVGVCDRWRGGAKESMEAGEDKNIVEKESGSQGYPPTRAAWV